MAAGADNVVKSAVIVRAEGLWQSPVASEIAA